MSDHAPTSKEIRLGVFAASVCYMLWGFLPIYLKAVGFADAIEILAERILFTIPAAIIAILLMSGAAKGWREVAGALRPKMLATLLLSALLIFFNWGLYVWAVAQNHVLEAALAYFLAPLAQVLVGVLLFGEKLRGPQKIALGLAALGVIVQGVALGAPPWIALALCASWVGYAVVRKQAPVPAATGLLVEAALLAPISVAILLWLSLYRGLAIDDNQANAWMLALLGPVTAGPLILFAFGARRISFATLGLLQYIAPSLQLLVGVAYGEPLTPLRIASFLLIWAGLIAFSWDSLAARRAPRPA